MLGELVGIGIVWGGVGWLVHKVTKDRYRPPVKSKHRALDPHFQYQALDLVLERLKREQALAHRLAVYEPLPGVPPAEDEAHDEPGEVFFKADEPTSFQEFSGQTHIVRPLQLGIRALPRNTLVLDHKLLTGMPGLGKTLLAKVVAKELQRRPGAERLRFVETYGLNLDGPEAMDAVVGTFRTAQAVVWFIDEIHVLNKELATKLYPLMEEGRYPFQGALNPEILPPVMVIGATTDYGSLHAALKRRFGEPMSVRAMSKQELTALAEKLGFPIEPAAVELLVSRCWQSGAPFELKILFRECRIFAQAQQAPQITVPIVQDVFDTYEIDEHGLRHLDRSVISALFQRPRYRGKAQEFICYGGSEADICAVSRLDRAEFQETIRPKLLSRSFLEIRSGVGLALTARAVELYTHLHPDHATH